jgi:NADP-dependent 3-hydroxy acid dehydrogenase YdfG
MRNVKGMVAWITGAGTGIGEATARRLAREGMTVILSGRRPEPLDAVAEEIRSAGGAAQVIALDVTDREAVLAAGQRIDAEHGRLDLQFNNAGTNVTARSWREAQADPSLLDGWDQVIDANVKGVYNGVAAALPIMLRQRDGVIATTASWAGRFYSEVAGAPYTASKHAVMALSFLIQREHGNQGIRATAICPGEVRTPILDRRPVKLTEQELASVIPPEDVADVVAFLAALNPVTCLNEILMSPTFDRHKA